MHQYTLRDYQLENSSAKKDTGVLVDTKLIISQQSTFAAKEANTILGCIRQSIGSRSRELSTLMKPYLLSTDEAISGVLCPVWAPQFKKNMNLL